MLFISGFQDIAKDAALSKHMIFDEEFVVFIKATLWEDALDIVYDNYLVYHPIVVFIDTFFANAYNNLVNNLATSDEDTAAAAAAVNSSLTNRQRYPKSLLNRMKVAQWIRYENLRILGMIFFIFLDVFIGII